jgi:hypothetical protein
MVSNPGFTLQCMTADKAWLRQEGEVFIDKIQ